MVEEIRERRGWALGCGKYDSPTGFVSRIQWQVRRQRKVAAVC